MQLSEENTYTGGDLKIYYKAIPHFKVTLDYVFVAQDQLVQTLGRVLLNSA